MKRIPYFLLALLGWLPSVARADSFNISYLGSGVQASPSSTYVEAFNGAGNANGTYTTTFNGSRVTGTYSGTGNLVAANAYGGANGTGTYVTTASGGTGSGYTLSLSSNINYFGLWFSALDAGNLLQFYSGDTLLLTFSSADFIKAVGACPGSAYCGNPNNGQDTYEQFAFINFFDTNGSFNKIVFSQAAGYGGEFESDNHTIGNLTSAPGGTPLTVTPEPSSLVLLGTGMLIFAVIMRWRIAVRG